MKNRWLTGFNKYMGNVEAMLAYFNQCGIKVIDYNDESKIAQVLYNDKKLFILLTYFEVSLNADQTKAIVNIIKPEIEFEHENQCVFLGMNKYMDQWIFFAFNNQILKLEGENGGLHAEFIFRNADHLALTLKYCDAGQLELPYIINNKAIQRIPAKQIKSTFVEYQVTSSLPGTLDFLLETNNFDN